MTSNETRSVRSLLAARTARDHEALHSHPWISSFEDPCLTEDRYLLVLSAYHAFLSSVEAARVRLDAFPGLSLQGSIENLAADLAPLPQTATYMTATHANHIADRCTLLGNLYVIHGAGFGGATLNAHVKKALPAVSRRYLGQGTPADLWRGLMRELEKLAGHQNDLDRLISGAITAFQSFGNFVTTFCEQAPEKPRLTRTSSA